MQLDGQRLTLDWDGERYVLRDGQGKILHRGPSAYRLTDWALWEAGASEVRWTRAATERAG